MTSGRSRGARLRVGVLVVALGLLVSGCYTQTARQHQAASPDTRPYYCNAVGEGTPPGGHGNGNHVHEHYQGMTKGPLSWEDCDRLSNQLDALLHAVEGLETRSAGEGAGWRELAHYIPGLGTHHGNNLDFITGNQTFDPAKPTMLIYGGQGPDAPLVGVSYSLGAGNNPTPPEAFAGSNDWWHLHTKVCVGPEGFLAGGEEIPDEECAALGGRQMTVPGGGQWLLHVWMVPDYQLEFDIFTSGHPCLGEAGPLPWEDPCWEEFAHHDPADGPLPGMEHDDAHGDADHGEHGH